jgi:hypothetical protein
MRETGRQLPLAELCHGETCHTAVLHRDPFGAQPPGLLFVLRRRLRKHDAAARTDDAMPRQMQRIGRHL